MEITNFVQTPLKSYELVVGHFLEFDVEIDQRVYHVNGFVDQGGQVSLKTKCPHSDKVAAKIKSLM